MNPSLSRENLFHATESVQREVQAPGRWETQNNDDSQQRWQQVMTTKGKDNILNLSLSSEDLLHAAESVQREVQTPSRSKAQNNKDIHSKDDNKQRPQKVTTTFKP